jgi:hypothetical protein
MDLSLQKLIENRAQIDHFRDAARQIGCNEHEAAFDEKLAGSAKQKLPVKQQPEEK